MYIYFCIHTCMDVYVYINLSFYVCRKEGAKKSDYSVSTGCLEFNEVYGSKTSSNYRLD